MAEYFNKILQLTNEVILTIVGPVTGLFHLNLEIAKVWIILGISGRQLR